MEEEKNNKKEHKYLGASKLTDNKYLNYYIAHYDGGVDYCLASRRSEEDLAVANPNKLVADAVRIVPYFYKDGKMYVVLIREFRYPINNYIYGVPAGCVDKGESEESTAIREVAEEIGAKVKKLKKVGGPCYSSAGMSDEALSFFEAEVEIGGTQHLDENEDIEIKYCPIDRLMEVLKSQHFGMQSRLQLEAFYYKVKAGEIENTK